MGQQRAIGRLSTPRVAGAVCVLASVVSGVGFAVSSPPAQSTPDHSNAFNARYDTRGTKLEGCKTCHQSDTGNRDNLNSYGIDFGSSGYDFAAIEGRDSDGDGAANINEIKARTFPGDPNDKPM